MNMDQVDTAPRDTRARAAGDLRRRRPAPPSPELLDAARITVHLGVARADAHAAAASTPARGPQLVVDCVVALPLLEGPELDGIPSTAHGFIPVDDAGLVDGLDGVYAVGDATDRPIKQGGLACQQADVTAAHIAARAGADVDVPPLQQVLRGRLLTGHARPLPAPRARRAGGHRERRAALVAAGEGQRQVPLALPRRQGRRAPAVARSAPRAGHRRTGAVDPQAAAVAVGHPGAESAQPDRPRLSRRSP